MAAKRKFFIVSAFSPVPGKGNPAAVVLLHDGDTGKVNEQKIATEFNLSETVFIYPRPEANTYGIRWFTPTKEVQLCGHATLAAAHALRLAASGIPETVFENHLAGRLRVLTNSSSSHPYELHFPSRRPTSLGDEGRDLGSRLAACFGLQTKSVSDVAFHEGSQKYYLVLADDAAIVAAKPDFAKLRAVDFPKAPLSVTLTALSSSPEFDVASRHFAPWVGIDEDPVTGAAHVGLVPYWLGTPRFADTKELRCTQLFPGRGGDLLCKVVDESTVSLKGAAHKFAEGELDLIENSD